MLKGFARSRPRVPGQPSPKFALSAGRSAGTPPTENQTGQEARVVPTGLSSRAQAAKQSIKSRMKARGIDLYA